RAGKHRFFRGKECPQTARFFRVCDKRTFFRNFDIVKTLRISQAPGQGLAPGGPLLCPLFGAAAVYAIDLFLARAWGRPRTAFPEHFRSRRSRAGRRRARSPAPAPRRPP